MRSPAEARPRRDTAASQAPPADRAAVRGWLALAALAAGAAYAGTLRHQLVWDDLLLGEVIEARLRHGGLLELLTSEFLLRIGDPLGYYRPSVLLSLWADSRLAALVPVSHHLTNVLLHALVSVLVFAFLRLTLASVRAAGVGAVLFALHPVHTESVAFVSGRTDLLAALFALLAAVFWAAGRQAPGPAPWKHQVAAGLSLCLAALSKEVAFVLPVVLLAWDALEVREGPARSWRSRNAAWLLCWAAALAVVFLLRWAVAGVGVGVGQGGAGWSPGAFAAAAVTYLRLLVLPWPLSAYYSAAQAAPGWVAAASAGVFLAGCALTAARAHRRVGLLTLAWTAGFLLPVLGAAGLNAAVLAERFLYLPSVGVCLLLGYAADRLARRGNLRVPVLAAVAALAVAAAAGTVARSRVWRDDGTLFSDMVARDPANHVGRYNLALHLHRAGDLERAKEHYLAAARLNPRNPEPYIGLGVISSTFGLYRDEASWYEQALAIDPRNVRALTNLREAYVALGDAAGVRRAEERIRGALPAAGR